MNLDELLIGMALVGFAASTIAYIAGFRDRRGRTTSGASHRSPGPIRNAALVFFIIATLLTTASLIAKPSEFNLTRDSAILLTAAIAWATVFAHTRFHMRTVGTFIGPLATMILLVWFYAGRSRSIPLPEGYAGIFMTVHVVLAILGEATAIAACGISGIYLRQNRLLKQRRLASIESGAPPLDKLERMLMASLWAGLILITGSLLTGAFFSHFWGVEAAQATSQYTKITWGILVWLWYTVTLSVRSIHGLPVTTVAKMSFIGFLLLATTFFGVFGIPAGGGS